MASLLRLTFIALAISATLNAQADSIASSASSAGSDSSGSVSDSIHGSSNSSSSKDNKVADRDYHVVDVAQAPQKPGMARVTMQANDSDWRVMLDVPQAVVDREQLSNGAQIHAQQRVYGIAFEHGETRQAFFLALNDNWANEFDARKVSL